MGSRDDIVFSDEVVVDVTKAGDAMPDARVDPLASARNLSGIHFRLHSLTLLPHGDGFSAVTVSDRCEKYYHCAG